MRAKKRVPLAVTRGCLVSPRVRGNPAGRVTLAAWRGRPGTGGLYRRRTHVRATGSRRSCPFASDDYRGAPSTSRPRPFQQYFGYFGTYKVDASAGTVTLSSKAPGSRISRTSSGADFPLRTGPPHLEAATPWGVVRIHGYGRVALSSWRASEQHGHVARRFSKPRRTAAPPSGGRSSL